MKLRRGRLSRVILCGVLLALILVVLFMPKPGGHSYLQVQKRKVEFREGVPSPQEPKGGNEPQRSGPGEGGEAWHARPEDANAVAQAMVEYGMNMVASDQIALDRTIPDMRPDECRFWHYPMEDLPTVSVVIVFHNEGHSTLLRTVHSVLNRSPPHLLHEIVLVDDFSDKVHLKGKLEDDVVHLSGGKVKLYRNPEREGLIRSRTRGAELSTGDVVLYLDAHCEVGINWLPPLLAPIYLNRTVVTVPTIDGIDKDTMEYRPVYQGERHFRGIFEWGMLYKETELPPEMERTRSHHSEPYHSPTHAGGLFAINREYFLELGGYDPGLLVWGGENFELSFKVWQCGGSIMWVPCSKVGHIYRGFMPYSFGKLAEKRKGPIVTVNYKRVVEVWMDEYKEHFYTREPMARNYDSGDISEQVALKKRLQCRSFGWFMENVAYDVLRKFPLLPPNLHWGEVRSLLTGQCLDTMSSHPPSVVGMSHCHGSGGNQLFRLNAQGQLGVGERCVNADADAVKLVFCALGTVDGPWSYDAETKLLQHDRLRQCVELRNENGEQLQLQTCDASHNGQKWIFRELH